MYKLKNKDNIHTKWAMINETVSLAEELALQRQTSEGNMRRRKISTFYRFLSITDEEEEKHFKIQKEVCIVD